MKNKHMTISFRDTTKAIRRFAVIADRTTVSVSDAAKAVRHFAVIADKVWREMERKGMIPKKYLTLDD